MKSPLCSPLAFRLERILPCRPPSPPFPAVGLTLSRLDRQLDFDFRRHPFQQFRPSPPWPVTSYVSPWRRASCAS